MGYPLNCGVSKALQVFVHRDVQDCKQQQVQLHVIDVQTFIDIHCSRAVLCPVCYSIPQAQKKHHQTTTQTQLLAKPRTVARSPLLNTLSCFHSVLLPSLLVVNSSSCSSIRVFAQYNHALQHICECNVLSRGKLSPVSHAQQHRSSVCLKASDSLRPPCLPDSLNSLPYAHIDRDWLQVFVNSHQHAWLHSACQVVHDVVVLLLLLLCVCGAVQESSKVAARSASDKL
eukprot:2271-Heterococcus_DN1.PRE.3